MSIIDDLKNYTPFDRKEEQDIKFIIDFYKKHNGNIFTRDNEEGHMTSSCWILNRDKKKVLMAYHNIYKSFAWLGGHADGDTDLIHVAIKELVEESGVKNPKLLLPHIFSVEVITCPEHIKKGKVVKTHDHLNFTYLFEVDESETLKIKEDENSAIRWIEIDKLFDYVKDKDIMEQIYKKLIKKLFLLNKNQHNVMGKILDDNKERI